MTPQDKLREAADETLRKARQLMAEGKSLDERMLELAFLAGARLGQELMRERIAEKYKGARVCGNDGERSFAAEIRALPIEGDE